MMSVLIYRCKEMFGNKKVSYPVVYTLCISFFFFFFLRKLLSIHMLNQVVGHGMDTKLFHANYSKRDEI